jgi:ankyrin repeat protein
MNIHDMLKTLELPSKHPSSQNLTVLKLWCEENISRDVAFTGSLAHQYNDYAQLAASYQTFKEIVATDLTQEMTALGQINGIQFAAIHGYDRVIEHLTVDSIAINQATKPSNMTALHFAAGYGHLHTVNNLLKKGADPTLRDNNNDYPAMHCLMLSIKSRDRVTRERIFHLLNKNMPELYTHTNTAGNNIFHLLAQNGFTRLLEEALKINPYGACQINQDGNQPINLAIRSARETINVQMLLLSQQPSIAQIHNMEGNLPLHDAAQYIQDEILIQAYIEAHIKVGLSLDLTNTHDETPLMLAVKAKNLNFIEMLLQNGADPTHRNALDQNILDCAYQISEDKLLCEWILEKAPQLDRHQLGRLIAQGKKLTP